MRSARVLMLVGLICLLAGCGTSPRDQVRAKVQQFAQATAQRDVAALCDQVLAPSLVRRLTAAGLSCPQAMRLFVGSVQHPTISISRIRITGRSASAVVLAGATAQPAALEQIQLINTAHGWRLLSLASPR